MAQPDSVQANGIPGPDHAESPQPVVPVKRKRDTEDEGDEVNGDGPEKMEVDAEVPKEDHKPLIKNYFAVLSRYDCRDPLCALGCAPSPLRQPRGRIVLTCSPKLRCKPVNSEASPSRTRCGAARRETPKVRR